MEFLIIWRELSDKTIILPNAEVVELSKEHRRVSCFVNTNELIEFLNKIKDSPDYFLDVIEIT